jgi:hypothetical protein
MSQITIRYESEINSVKEEKGFIENKLIGLQQVEQKVQYMKVPEVHVIYRQEEGLLKRVKMYEDKHSEMTSEIMSLRS